MSNVEKLIIPFVDKDIKKADFTTTAGFVDVFEQDEDSPNAKYNIYLMYDLDINNKYTQDRARRFSLSKNLLKTYTKIIGNKPYLVYYFYVQNKYKKFFSNIISLSADEKLKVINFWGTYDSIAKYVLDNPAFQFTGSKSIPAEDYIPQTKGVTIQKVVL